MGNDLNIEELQAGHAQPPPTQHHPLQARDRHGHHLNDRARPGPTATHPAAPFDTSHLGPAPSNGVTRLIISSILCSLLILLLLLSFRVYRVGSGRTMV